MPTLKVRNLKNKEVGDVNLSDEVFGVDYNEGLVHAGVRNYLANGRQGTAKTKTRGEVRGGGRKPWRQKGTGRARVHSIRSPLWRGGGRVHGPVPKDWSYELPKKMRRGAIRSALAERIREGNVIILDGFTMDSNKTRDFVAIMKTLELADGKNQVKTLIVDSLDNENLLRSSRNVKNAKVVNGYGVNVYDVVYHQKLLISKAGLAELEELLNPVREKKSAAKEVA